MVGHVRYDIFRFQELCSTYFAMLLRRGAMGLYFALLFSLILVSSRFLSWLPSSTEKSFSAQRYRQSRRVMQSFCPPTYVVFPTLSAPHHILAVGFLNGGRALHSSEGTLVVQHKTWFNRLSLCLLAVPPFPRFLMKRMHWTDKTDRNQWEVTFCWTYLQETARTSK